MRHGVIIAYDINKDRKQIEIPNNEVVIIEQNHAFEILE